MENGVGDRGGDATRAEFADATRADRAAREIWFVDKRNVQSERYVGIYRHQRARQIFRKEAAEAVIHFGLFEKSLTHAPCKPAEHLASRGLRIDDLTRVENGDAARDARNR